MHRTYCWILAAPLWTSVALASGGHDFASSGSVRFDAPELAVRADTRATAGEQERIRVAFYNIENFSDGDGDGLDRTPERVAAQARDAAALIDEIQPDLLFLAEIENEQALRILNAALANPFPFGWVARFGVEDGHTEKLHAALLSRFAPDEIVELDFGAMQGGGRPPRGALRAVFDLGEGHRLAAYTVHLKSNYGYRPRNMYKRKHALEPITADARALRKQKGANWEILLLGDFNVDPESPEFQDDWSLSPLRGWTDLWRGSSLDARTTVPTRYGDPARAFPPVCFDRIFVAGDATNAPWRVSAPAVLPRGVHTENVHVLPGDAGHVSDHYPVWVDLLR